MFVPLLLLKFFPVHLQPAWLLAFWLFNPIFRGENPGNPRESHVPSSELIWGKRPGEMGEASRLIMRKRTETGPCVSLFSFFFWGPTLALIFSAPLHRACLDRTWTWTWNSQFRIPPLPCMNVKLKRMHARIPSNSDVMFWTHSYIIGFCFDVFRHASLKAS